MYTRLNASRAYVYAVARACDRGQISRKDCAGAILYSTEKSIEVALEAMQSLGGNGYINGMWSLARRSAHRLSHGVIFELTWMTTQTILRAVSYVMLVCMQSAQVPRRSAGCSLGASSIRSSEQRKQNR